MRPRDARGARVSHRAGPPGNIYSQTIGLLHRPSGWSERRFPAQARDTARYHADFLRTIKFLLSNAFWCLLFGFFRVFAQPIILSTVHGVTRTARPSRLWLRPRLVAPASLPGALPLRRFASGRCFASPLSSARQRAKGVPARTRSCRLRDRETTDGSFDGLSTSAVDGWTAPSRLGRQLSLLLEDP